MRHPRQEDSAIGNEVAVSASGGVVRSDLEELASQTAYNGAYYQYATTTTAAEAAKETKKNEYATEKNKEYNSETWTTDAAKETAYTSTTEAAKETAYTTTAAGEYAMPTYGSGYSYWGGKGYNDCVQRE